jgi:hypothetical protein
MGDLNHMHMGMEFFYFALKNMWKVFAVLPHKEALTTADGRVQRLRTTFAPQAKIVTHGTNRGVSTHITTRLGENASQFARKLCPNIT